METSSDFVPQIELGGNLSIRRLSSFEDQGRFGVLSNTLPVNLFVGPPLSHTSRYLFPQLSQSLSRSSSILPFFLIHNC